MTKREYSKHSCRWRRVFCSERQVGVKPNGIPFTLYRHDIMNVSCGRDCTQSVTFSIARKLTIHSLSPRTYKKTGNQVDIVKGRYPFRK